MLPQPVLAADTTLEFAGEIIGKPRDAADATAALGAAGLQQALSTLTADAQALVLRSESTSEGSL